MFHRIFKLKFDIKNCQWMQGVQRSFLVRQIDKFGKKELTTLSNLAKVRSH